MPPLEYWVAGAMMGSLLIFALAGGADFGGGIWTFFGARTARPRTGQPRGPGHRPHLGS